jgi:hypothetical protein
MDESEHEKVTPMTGKGAPSLATATGSVSVAVRDDSRQEDERMLYRSFRDGVATIERDLIHPVTDKVKSIPEESMISLIQNRLIYLDELKRIQLMDSNEGYNIPQLRWAPSEEWRLEITESSSATDDETPLATKEFIRSIQRGSVSCPHIPLLDEELSMTGEDDVKLLLRNLAWSQDSLDQKRLPIHRTSFSVPSSGESGVHKYRRSDSLQIDSQNSISETESPTSTWVYWEEKLFNPVDLRPEE